MTTEKFLEFNGKKLTLVNADGKFYVAIKPICEALNVHYKAQHKAISEDEILSQLSSIQRIVAADNKQREMLCLPEKYIYGWLFSINSESEHLKKYKLECYEILYNHFHNIIADRVNELQQKKQLQEAHQKLHLEQMATNSTYRQLVELQQKLKAVNKALAQNDNTLLNGQIEMSFENN